jgi:hypothetical protein
MNIGKLKGPEEDVANCGNVKAEFCCNCSRNRFAVYAEQCITVLGHSPSVSVWNGNLSLTEDEMYVVLAHVMVMSIVQEPALRSCFSKNLG